MTLTDEGAGSGIPELLAPAGSREALTAAVAAGADAVYLGGKRFGARKFAANFDEVELEEAVTYAHTYGVKVYVTVNTLIHDDELPDALRYLVWLYSIGVDAVLVQDLGLAALAHETVPGLPLHASTQLSIHNRKGVIWAARSGFSRVVLAREMGLPEISDIRKQIDPPIGLEVFVHGALCYCYSGQCLLSSVIGGRSGNRGMCAQPCRKPYSLLKGQSDEYGRPVRMRTMPLRDGYLLSTRDLATYPHLDTIVSAPICALKIEGRMRSPEYVAIVVDIYRRALDALSEGAWTPAETDMRDLALAFNRDFTGGYLMGARYGEVMGRERPGNRGLYIGKVESYDRRRGEAGVAGEGAAIPERGDGVEFVPQDQRREGFGMVLQREPAQRKRLFWIPVRQPVDEGDCVFITRKAALEAHARTLIARQPAPIPIDVLLTWEEDGTPVLSGTFPGPSGIRLSVRHRSRYRMMPALQHPLTEEGIRSRLERTGGTPFAFRRIEMQYPGGLFSPIGDLNRLRREFLDAARFVLLAAYRPAEEEVKRAEVHLSGTIEALTPRPLPEEIGNRMERPSLACYADTLEIAKEASESGYNRIYFEPRMTLSSPCPESSAGSSPVGYGNTLLTHLREATAYAAEQDACIVWKWPRVTRRPFLDVALPLLPRAYEAGVRHLMVEGAGLAEAALAVEPRIQVMGAAGLNIFNHRAALRLSPPLQLLTLSPELSAAELARLVHAVRAAGRNVILELMVQGNTEAMVTEDCIPCTVPHHSGVGTEASWGLLDSRERLFPLLLDNECRTHIFNAVELCLIDHMPELFCIGLSGLAVDARGRTPRYVREMAEIYTRAISTTAAGSAGWEEGLSALKEEAKRMSRGGITAGHFVKGLREDEAVR